MTRNMTKNMRSKMVKKTKKLKMSRRIKQRKQTMVQKRGKAKTQTKGRHGFKRIRARTRKQKGGSLFPETDLMLQNISEKISATQNTIQGAHIETSGKSWIQPELTKY